MASVRAIAPPNNMDEQHDKGEIKMNCNEIYETGLLYHHYANTAYPLTPHSFMQYR